MAWNPPYATPAELAGWLTTADAVLDVVPLTLAIESASRAIDTWTGRQFGQADEAETRFYTPDFDHRTREWYASIDDVMTTDDILVEVAGEEVEAFALTPRNATLKGKPYSGIEYRHYGSHHDELAITALWGWSAIPEAIKTACLIQAGRIYGRRESPGGPLIGRKVDDVDYRWGNTSIEIDTDVAASLSSYRRIWAAA